MNKYEYAFKFTLTGFILLLIVAVTLSLIPENLAESFANSAAVKIILLLLICVCCLSGFYLWFTGFKRFKPTIGHYSFNWVMYVAFNLLAAIYLHWQYKKQNN